MMRRAKSNGSATSITRTNGNQADSEEMRPCATHAWVIVRTLL